MIRKFLTALTALVFIVNSSSAQVALKYQMPPEEIVKIVDAPQTPSISVSPDKQNILLIERQGLISIEKLSSEELRIAGLRIDPAISGPSRQTYNTGYMLMNIDGTNLRKISGLPENPALGFPEWSNDGKKFAFTNTRENTIELWYCDVTTLKAAKITEDINLVFGNQISWLS